MRSADGVGDHHTQRDAGVPEQGGSDGGMTVQVEIVLHGRCDLRACELRAFRIVAARGAAGFLGGAIALVEGTPGRAYGREGVWQVDTYSVVAGLLKKKTHNRS